MTAPRLAGLRKVIVRFACCLAALVAFVYLCNYVSDARTRATKAPDCVWDPIPNPESEPYTAYYCVLSKGTILLRLYDITEQHLLAERTFSHADWPNFFWKPMGLGYDAYPDGDLIALPPSLFERLRAKLP